MFKTILFSLFIITSIVTVFAQRTTTKPDPAKDVRAAFDRLVEGIRQADVEKVMNVYDNSDRTLFFNNNGSVTLGWQQMKENRESSYAKTENVTLETTGVRVEILGPNSAYVSCKWKQTQVYEGKLEDASGRMTLIFRKIGKDWKVVHLHTSPDNSPVSRPILDSERPRTVPDGQ
jgi:ketosteroid isomerase-like protein